MRYQHRDPRKKTNKSSHWNSSLNKITRIRTWVPGQEFWGMRKAPQSRTWDRLKCGSQAMSYNQPWCLWLVRGWSLTSIRLLRIGCEAGPSIISVQWVQMTTSYIVNEYHHVSRVAPARYQSMHFTSFFMNSLGCKLSMPILFTTTNFHPHV